MAEQPTRISHGIFAGHWATLLWKMMQHLGYNQRPTYQGYMYKVGNQERWRLEVILYANLQPNTNHHIFDAPVRRDNFVDGLQDAAREATRRLRHIYNNYFEDSEFHYHPMHIPTRLDSTFRPAEYEDSPELTHQVDLSKAMDYAYGNTLDELRNTQNSLLDAEERLKAAEEELAIYKAGEGSTCEPDYTPLTP